MEPFLTSVLGPEAAQALMKAAEREPALGFLLVPRAALAWLTGRTRYEGVVPGMPNSYLRLEKTEKGWGGIITLPESNYEFCDSADTHVAAAISLAAGVDPESKAEIRDHTLVRLGKSVDALVEARHLIKKVLDPNEGYHFKYDHNDGISTVTAHSKEGETVGVAKFQHRGPELHGFLVNVDDAHQRRGLAGAMYSHAEKNTGKKVVPSSLQTDEGKAFWGSRSGHFDKTELPGQTAKPFAQKGPVPPEQPKKQPKGAIKLPRKPKGIPSLKVEKSDTQKPCDACEGQIFSEGRFVGCLCWSALAPDIKTTVYSDGSVLDFAKNMDPMAVLSLVKALK